MPATLYRRRLPPLFDFHSSAVIAKRRLIFSPRYAISSIICRFAAARRAAFAAAAERFRRHASDYTRRHATLPLLDMRAYISASCPLI